jgi:hypothetical protein
MKLEGDDIAFVLGRAGATKRKLARVSGAKMNIEESDSTLYISGNPKAVARAQEYVKLVLAQRVGPVYIDFEKNKQRDDFSVVEVPRDCVGYVTGRGGQVLRNLEMEWKTLMFFGKTKGHDGEDGGDGGKERLAIFGDRRGRKGAELKVLSAVEHKCKGFFLDGETPKWNLDADVPMGTDWATETKPLQRDEFSYALGRQGSTRKKLAWSSGCIVQYVGSVAFFSGTAEERWRAKDYLRMLLQQRRGGVTFEREPDAREDCLVMKVPKAAVGFVTGYKGQSLRDVERRSRSFCFTSRKPLNHGSENGADSGAAAGGASDVETVLIFAHSEKNRREAKRLIEDLVEQKARMDSGGGRGGGYGGRGRDGNRDRRDSRDFDRRGGGRNGYRGRRDSRDFDDRRGRGYDDRRGGRGGYGDRRGSYDDRRGGYDDRRRGYDDRRGRRSRSRDRDRRRDRDYDRRGGRGADRGGDRAGANRGGDRGGDRGRRRERSRSRSRER